MSYKIILSEKSIDKEPTTLTTSNSKISYQYRNISDIMVTYHGSTWQIVISFIDSSKIQEVIDLNSVTNQPTWTNDVTGANQAYADIKANFSSATGGSVASDFDFTTVINETFSDTYDQSRVTVTNGTLTTAGGKLIVNCAQAEIASGSTLPSGTANTGITKVVFNLGVYGKTMMTELNLRFKVKILTAPTAGRRYFGQGVDANGLKTPVDGGWLCSVSSTLANNALFLKDQENARRALNALTVANDEFDIYPRLRDGYCHFSVYKNGTFLGSYRTSVSGENDNLQRSSGQFCLYGWGLNFEIHEYQAIDIQPKNMDVVIIGDSNTQGWGTEGLTDEFNYSSQVEKRSSKVIGVYGCSSLMLADVSGILHQPMRNLKKGGLAVFWLGTNDASASPVRTLAEMQADTQAIITAVNALGKNHKILFLTPPPIGGSTTQNTKTHDFSQWLLATNLGANVTASNVRSVLTAPSLTTWNLLLSNDGTFHLNEEGHLRVFDYLKANNPELF